MNSRLLLEGTLWSEIGLLAAVVLFCIVVYRIIRMRTPSIRALSELPLHDGAREDSKKGNSHV